MLLRRVIEHVKNQNWTAVALDFAIVVIGVFAGIQVSNWNENRAASSNAEIYTDRLLGDLREEAWIHRYHIAYYEDVLQAAERAMQGFEDEAGLTDEEFLINAYRASQYTWWNPRRATFDELVATGGLGLVKDARLRTTALAVYASPLRQEIEQRGRGSRYRETFRMTIPTDVHRAIAQQCGDQAIPVGDLDLLGSVLSYECSLGLPTETVVSAARILRGNPELAPALRLRIATIETQLSDLRENNHVTAFFDGLLESAE